MIKTDRFKKKTDQTAPSNKICRITRSTKRQLGTALYARICADVRADLHKRLKMYVAAHDKTIVELLEEWIVQNCTIEHQPPSPHTI